ncbi:septum formation family protein [Streptomyces massasporeus]
MSIPPPSGSRQPRDPFGPPPANPPQGMPGYGPYGPAGHAARPYGAAPVSVNALAVAALVLGVLCFLPAAGLVLGLIALWQIRRSGQSGRGLAIAGAVLSVVGIVLWVVVLSTGAASQVWEGFKDGARRGDEVQSLDKGDCFDAPGGLEGDTYDVDRVPCEGRHDAEVFAVVTLPGGAFPGDKRITDIADEKCYALQDQYAMDTWAMPADVDVYYLLPSRVSWRYGDRAITCLFGDTEAKAGLTGSLRTDPTTLDTDQVVFLSTANALDTALYEEPEKSPEDDLAAHRAWAGQVHDVLGEQIEALRGHSWPAGARGPLADLVEEMEDAREEWRSASTARDVDTYFGHYDKAYGSVDGPATVTARKALDLAATPPASGEGEGGTSEAQV